MTVSELHAQLTELLDHPAGDMEVVVGTDMSDYVTPVELKGVCKAMPFEADAEHVMVLSLSKHAGSLELL